MKKIKIAVVAVTLGLVAPGFSQQSQTWIPSGATDNWNTTDNNWDAGVAWINNNDATFGGTAETITVDEIGIIFNDISFNSGYAIADGAGTLLLGNDQASTISVASGVTATLAETIGDNAAGESGLTKSDTGTLLLSGANTYTGTTTIDQGILTLQGAAFSTTGRDYSIASGAVLNLDGTNNWASGTTTFNGDGTLLLTGGKLSRDDRNGGTVNMELGSDAMIDIESGATLQNGGWSAISWNNNTADMNVDGTLDVWDGNAVYVDSLTGTGTVTHTTYGASTDLIVGVDGGSGTFAGTLTDEGSGTALNLIKEGAGTQTLTGTISHKGDTIVNEGTLEFDIDNTQGLNAGTLGGGGTFVKSGSGTLMLGARNSEQLVSMTGGGLIDVQEGTLRNEYGQGNWTNNLADLNVAAGAIVDTWDSADGITVDALTGGGTVQHTRYGDANNLTVGINDGTGSFSGTLTDDGHDLNLVKAGAGTQTFTGANTHNGTTRAAAGTLAIENALGLQNSTLDLATADAGTVTFAQDSTLGGLTGSRNLDMGAHTLSIGNNGSDTDYSGTLSNGALVKTGTGQLTLSGDNTYTGGTFVNGGLLIMNGSMAGTVNVAAGQTLGGTGTFDGAVLVAGMLTPGNSPGTMTFNDALTLESTATLTLELDGTGAGLFDVLLNDGGDTLTAGGMLIFDTTDYTAVYDDTFTVFENWSAFDGTFSDIQGTDLGGGLSLDTTNLLTDGTVTVIPEPATLSLVAAFGAGILIIRRRFKV